VSESGRDYRLEIISGFLKILRKGINGGCRGYWAWFGIEMGACVVAMD